MKFSEIVNNPEFQSLIKDNWSILADWLTDKNVDQLFVDEARTGIVFFRMNMSSRNKGGGWESESGRGAGSGTGIGG